MNAVYESVTRKEQLKISGDCLLMIWNSAKGVKTDNGCIVTQTVCHAYDVWYGSLQPH